MAGHKSANGPEFKEKFGKSGGADFGKGGKGGKAKGMKSKKGGKSGKY